MSRKIERLSALAIGKMKKPGYHNDGDGLYLQVSGSGAKSWVFRYKLDKRPREMGLGSLRTFSLCEARERARAVRKLVVDGFDPIEARNQGRADRISRASRSMAFGVAAEKYIAAHESSWRNEKHVYQWRQSIASYANPVLEHVDVAAVDVGLVMQVLGPVWGTKTETAKRLRGRIERILDWAKALHLRSGDNPATWRGNLDQLLPNPAKISPVRHHPALPYKQISSFMGLLRSQPGLASLATEFAILTATRTTEALGARWSEIDDKSAIWTIPGSRMKAGREHRVPLSGAARSVLQRARLGADEELVFPGRKSGKSLSNMACLQLLRRMGRQDIVVHGFRSTFRDWAAEETSHTREVAEMALAHTIENKTEAAYRRGDLFEKRTRLMIDWAAACSS